MLSPAGMPPKSMVDIQRPEQASGNPTVAAGPSALGRAGAKKRFPARSVSAVIVVGLLAGGYAAFTNIGSPRSGDPQNSARALASLDEPQAASPAQRPVTTPMVVDAPQAPPPSNAQFITDSRVKDFVDQYVAAQNGANATELLRFYADRVDYFDQKSVGKDFILKDKQNYYRRWPEVNNRLASAVAVNRSNGEGAVQASYTINYRVNSAKRAENKAGLAREILDMRLVNGDLYIVAQRQQIVSTQN